MAPDLANLISPYLLDDLLALRCPWPKDKGVTYADVAPWSNAVPHEAKEQFLSIYWPVLVKISVLQPPPTVQDFIAILPESSSPEFPPRALALTILLDQIPRVLGRGTDARWTNDFFDALATSLSNYFLSLPEELQPYKPHRWMQIGYTCSHALVFIVLMFASLSHSEDIAIHENLHSRINDLREEMQTEAGTQDQFQDIDREDVLAFPRLIRAGMGIAEPSLYDFIYFRFAITEVHLPILRRFNRYPWRNGAVGREDTAAESQYAIDSKNFGQVSEGVKKQIRDDVENGRWTPLGAGS